MAIKYDKILGAVRESDESAGGNSDPTEPRVKTGSSIYLPGWFIATTTTKSFPTFTGDTLFIPIYVGGTTTYNAIVLNVASAGNTDNPVRVGLYNADLTNGIITPSTVIVDAGTVAVDSTGVKTATIDETLAKGYYFVVISISTGSITGLGLTAANVCYKVPVGGTSSSSSSVAVMNKPIYKVQGAGHETLYAGLADSPTVSVFLETQNSACVFLRSVAD